MGQLSLTEGLTELAGGLSVSLAIVAGVGGLPACCLQAWIGGWRSQPGRPTGIRWPFRESLR